MLEKCNMCPHRCMVNRLEGNVGRCKSGKDVELALVSIHMYEEPCISGEDGSGTIFFCNCNLNCVYCQNSNISQGNFKGKKVTTEKLANIFLMQQERKANNINLVTPTTYIEQIIDAIKIARNKGLKIPIIYNSNGYENLESLRKLDGYIDVYLPDIKYMEDNLGEKYSNVKNYSKVVKETIYEMYRQVGATTLNKEGMIKKGMIIRHLILPNNIENSKKVLKWIKENVDKEVYVSIMAQYFPTYKAKNIKELNRKITSKEYNEIMDYVDKLDFRNGYFQELGEHEEEYVPNFDLSNI